MFWVKMAASRASNDLSNLNILTIWKYFELLLHITLNYYTAVRLKCYFLL